jgi:hypothetical protein
MGVYLKAMQHQQRAETVTNKKRGQVKWLVPFLQKTGWWIRGNRDSASVCQRLGVRQHPHRALYRDVRVWLPDLEWVNDNCPGQGKEGSLVRIGAHGFNTEHIARRVIGTKSHLITLLGQDATSAMTARMLRTQTTPAMAGIKNQ